MKRKLERESPKRTISPSGESGPLQIVSESDTRRCVSLLVVPQRGVDIRWCANKDVRPQRMDLVAVPHQLEEGKSSTKDADPKGGWIMMSHIS